MGRVWSRVVATAADYVARGAVLNEAEARSIVLSICGEEIGGEPDQSIVTYLAYALARRTR